MNSGRDIAGGVYLRTYLMPLARWLDDPQVTDILVNQPGQVWIETSGGALELHSAPEVSLSMLQRLAQQIAAASHQGVNRAQPLLGATLPDGARVQIVAAPATRNGVALAVRKHVVQNLSLADLAQGGCFAQAHTSGQARPDPMRGQLKDLLDNGDVAGFLGACVRHGKTILVSGGTASGKTTFLNALIQEVPPQDRLIVIEDAPEIHLARENALGLIAVKGELGEAQVSVEDLLQAALRMRPNRLIVGEVRGREAFSFLRAINTGHPGSMTTIHADSPQGAFEQLAFMALQAGTNLSRGDVLSYARSVVDVVVQLARVNGRRQVDEIWYRGMEQDIAR